MTQNKDALASRAKAAFALVDLGPGGPTYSKNADDGHLAVFSVGRRPLPSLATVAFGNARGNRVEAHEPKRLEATTSPRGLLCNEARQGWVAVTS